MPLPASVLRVAMVVTIALCSCGDRLVYRPLTIDVQNMSASAETLVLKVFAEDEQVCSAINLVNVQSFATPHESRWMRSSAGERQIDLPPIDSDRAVIVVYTEDANGAAIQLACTRIDYSQIENRFISLRLSARMTRIISPWRTYSARSSWIGSSDAAGWRRCSSPAAWIERSKRSWS